MYGLSCHKIVIILFNSAYYCGIPENTSKKKRLFYIFPVLMYVRADYFFSYISNTLIEQWFMPINTENWCCSDRKFKSVCHNFLFQISEDNN